MEQSLRCAANTAQTTTGIGCKLLCRIAGIGGCSRNHFRFDVVKLGEHETRAGVITLPAQNNPALKQLADILRCPNNGIDIVGPDLNGLTDDITAFNRTGTIGLRKLIRHLKALQLGHVLGDAMRFKKRQKCCRIAFDLGLRILQNIVGRNIGNRPHGAIRHDIAFCQPLDGHKPVKRPHVRQPLADQPAGTGNTGTDHDCGNEFCKSRRRRHARVSLIIVVPLDA